MKHRAMYQVGSCFQDMVGGRQSGKKYRYLWKNADSMKKLFVPLLSLFTLVACSQKTVGSEPITKIDLNDLDGAYLVDVRTPEEYGQGHLDGAVNIDWFAPDFAERFQDVPKGRTIYVYCKMGGRSAKAQEKLRSMGYDHVVNLEGGYDAWMAAH